MPFKAGALAVWCVKATSSKPRVRSSVTRTGDAGLASRGVSRIFWKFSSETSASR